MSEATAALIVAIIAALTGLAALGWSVASWRREGPQLTLDAAFEGGDSIRVTAWNTGRSAAHISSFSFNWMETAPNFSPAFVPEVAPDIINGEYETVPANGNVHITISRLDEVGDSDGLLTQLRLGWPVWLAARTGPRRIALTRVSGLQEVMRASKQAGEP